MPSEAAGTHCQRCGAPHLKGIVATLCPSCSIAIREIPNPLFGWQEVMGRWWWVASFPGGPELAANIRETVRNVRLSEFGSACTDVEMHHLVVLETALDEAIDATVKRVSGG